MSHRFRIENGSVSIFWKIADVIDRMLYDDLEKKELIVSSCLETPEGRIALVKAMMEPIKIRL